MMCDTIDVYVAHHCIHQSSNVLILSFFAYVCANIKSVLQCSSTRFANACNGATREHGERKNNEVQHTRNRLPGRNSHAHTIGSLWGWLLEQRATITGKQRQGNRRVGMGPLAQANRSRLRKEDRHQGQPEKRGNQHEGIHPARQRDRSGVRCPRCRPNRVLRIAPICDQGKSA